MPGIHHRTPAMLPSSRRMDAAQTRMVSAGDFWPSQQELSPYLKYMAHARIPEFESDMQSLSSNSNCSRPNANPFWIMLLLVCGRLDFGQPSVAAVDVRGGTRCRARRDMRGTSM
jgi:hypothetical protein